MYMFSFSWTSTINIIFIEKCHSSVHSGPSILIWMVQNYWKSSQAPCVCVLSQFTIDVCVLVLLLLLYRADIVIGYRKYSE